MTTIKPITSWTNYLNLIWFGCLQKKRKFSDVEQIFFFPKKVQTELTTEDIDMLFEHYQKAVGDRERLLSLISTLKIDFEFLKDNDKKTRLYTGLPTWNLLLNFFKIRWAFSPRAWQFKTIPISDASFDSDEIETKLIIY